MQESLHYWLMANHLTVQKTLVARIKDTGLTPGQPKILDYLKNHDGAVQKEIAAGCHIEPASVTTILNGMEEKGYIRRQISPENRKYIHIFLTEKGRHYVKRLEKEFAEIEAAALENFTQAEKKKLLVLMEKLYNNLLNIREAGDAE